MMPPSSNQPPYLHGDDEDDNHWNDAASDPRMRPPSSLPTQPAGLKSLVTPHWSPQPLPPPRVDVELSKLSLLERAAEVLRYMFTKAEYWVSPGGALREWVKLNLRLGLLIAIPAVLVAPVVTLFLGQLSAWVTHLTETTSKLVLFPLSALLVVGLVCALVYLARALPWALMRRPSRRPPHYYDD
ncbi:hypothetical protein FEM03_05865 [Phragmitibacter flavus]|uniref:Uncharacterized protein n=1 Tax=Phragmitibacter flavus TaxID=2576071 RepID=A0A5R8KH63_9BACT|nr:hypothetical protein [Phragmitibacter flavus]TLD71663.1 hypothetical protein FEM03_05865 [Phragmitibacter flavus]